jgi:hypothetical protein
MMLLSMFRFTRIFIYGILSRYLHYPGGSRNCLTSPRSYISLTVSMPC